MSDNLLSVNLKNKLKKYINLGSNLTAPQTEHLRKLPPTDRFCRCYDLCADFGLLSQHLLFV